MAYRKVIILLISAQKQNKNTAIIRVIEGYAINNEITFYNPYDSGVFDLIFQSNQQNNNL